MHRLLERQIRKYIKNNKVPKGLEALFEAISNAYQHFDEDRLLIERSLELSSKEMNEKNRLLSEKMTQVQQNSEEIKHLNDFMVNRELKMVELKEIIKGLEKKLASLKK